MPNLYDALITILRDHWKAHDHAYPQRIVLSSADMQTLQHERRLVNETMNFKLSEDWEQTFHGTPVEAGTVSSVVDVNGQVIPVSLLAVDFTHGTASAGS